MRAIPPAHRKIIDSDPYFKQCAREAIFHDHDCQGRITIEHALIFRGRQVVELFAYVPLCAFAHGVDEYQDSKIFDKRKNEYLALIRATTEDMAKYPTAGWEQKLLYLTKLYEKEIASITEAPF
jgi:hypothetical protein